jgi:hypothetical protein
MKPRCEGLETDITASAASRSPHIVASNLALNANQIVITESPKDAFGCTCSVSRPYRCDADFAK